MKKTVFGMLLAATAYAVCGCSLKYDDEVNAEDKVPEFVFEDAALVRYENRRRTLEFDTERLEQYKNSSESYAKNVSFVVYDDDGEVETSGSCGYLSADTDSELYELYDDIQLKSTAKEMEFSSDLLRWNGKTEQLTGGRRALVRVQKDDAVIYGSGFSASSVSGDFSFSGTVTGVIETE